MKWFLKVRSLGLPREVGPFDTKEEATAWGEKVVKNGEWNALPLENPTGWLDKHDVEIKFTDNTGETPFSVTTWWDKPTEDDRKKLRTEFLRFYTELSEAFE